MVSTTEPPAYLVTADLGHHHVQQDQVGVPAFVEGNAALPAVHGGMDLVEVRQGVFKYQQIVCLVVDDQHMGAASSFVLHPFRTVT